MAPILIQYAPTTQDLDQAGIVINKRVLPTYNPGYYTPKLLPDHFKPLDTLDYVPPLEYFCVNKLYPIVDLIDLGGLPRFPFHPEAHLAWLRGLIPFFTSDMRDVDLKYVDPRLWGTLIQLYTSLPLFFRTYTLPLSDTHLTQLQAIRSTPDFTLITVLDLSSRREITDGTIGALKPLVNLCILDLSLTRIGAWGVKKLSMCLVRKPDGRVGPWGIRIWSLRGCKRVDDSAKDSLARFPLLSVVDLRDTAVTSHFPGFTARPPSTYTSFYYPNPPLSWINGLCQTFPGGRIFQSSDMDSRYVLHINRLEYPTLHPQNSFRGGIEKVKRVGEHDRVLALFSSGRKALYTTHYLSQDPVDQGGGLTKRLSEKLQTANRHRRDAYGSEDPHDYGFGSVGDRYGSEYGDVSEHDSSGGDGSVYDRGNDDLTEDSFSESSLSEEHTEDDGSESGLSEYDQDALHAGLTTGSFDIEPKVSLVHSIPRRELIETHNEVAALVSERQAAEHEACRFFSQPDFRHWSSARPLLREGNDATRGIAHATKHVLPPTSRQLSQMFFRQPPAYDSVSHDSTPATEHVHRTKPDEPIIAKKRKTGAGGACFPMALLNRQAVGGHQDGREVMSAGCSQSGFRWPGDLHTYSPYISMNPFLAKRLQAQSSAILHLIPPTPPCRASTTTGLADSTVWSKSQSKTRPLSQPKSKREPRLIAAAETVSVEGTMHRDKKGPESKEMNRTRTCLDAKEPMIKAKQGGIKQPEAFDMRAWAMQTNK